MDGRPHPSKTAPHPFGGFSTGRWDGNTLVVTTTHMKAGYVRRNGVPSSENTVTTEFITRHGDTLTITAIIDDPAYLAEPLVISRSWQDDPATNVTPYTNPCVPAIEAPGLVHGDVPHYLPSENPFLTEMTGRYNIPSEAVLGQPHTLYPEYRKTLQSQYKLPPTCTR